jgi:hypothetical protein
MEQNLYKSFFLSLSGVNATGEWPNTVGLLFLLLLFYSPSSTGVVKLLLYPTVLSESTNSKCFYLLCQINKFLGAVYFFTGYFFSFIMFFY